MNYEISMQLSPQIIDYEDYRDFLKDRFEFIQKNSPKFSYRYLALKVGTSSNTFNYLFSHQRNISINLVSKTAKVFKLNHLETQYLMFCVIKNSVRDKAMLNTLNDFLNKLKDRIRNQATRSLSQGEESIDTEDWLRLIIKKISLLANYKNDATWIRAQLVNSDIHDEQEIRRLMSKEDIDKEPHQTLMPQLLEEFFDSILDYRPSDFEVFLLLVHSQDFHKVREAQEKFLNRIRTIEDESKNPDILLAIYGAAMNVTKEHGKQI